MKIVLIIWVMSYNYGAASTSIEGFTSLQNCKDEKTILLDSARQNPTRSTEKIRAFCVIVD